MVGSILDDAELHASVIAAVLTATKRSPSVDLVLDAMTAADARQLHRSLILRDTMDPVLERLLSHPAPVIAAATVLALHGGVPSPVWHRDGNAATLWRRAVLQLDIDDVSPQERWRVDRLMSHLARNDPDLFERWFEVQLGKHSYFRGQIRIRQDEEEPLAILPRVHRERLARRCAGLQYTGANPLTALIGADAELAATLLQEGVASTDMLLDAMLGQRGAMLEALGPLLIRDGVTPEQIAATGNWDTVWGHESSVHQKRLDYFTELAKRDDSDLSAIGRAGIQQQQKLVDQALAHERSQRVRGNL